MCYANPCPITGQAAVTQYFNAQETATQIFFGHSQPIPLGSPGKASGTGQMGAYQTWMIYTLFRDSILRAMQNMAEQMTGVMMEQAFIFGSYLDAQEQLATQQTLQSMAAQAHREFQPSVGMCVFGTNVRSLGGADQNAYVTETILNEQEIQRQLQSAGKESAEGTTGDLDSRIAQFTTRYCDPLDNNAAPGDPASGLGLICKTSANAATVNKDIDYMRTILLPRTINMDLTAGTLSSDAQDVIAMSNNLYSHYVFQGMTPEVLAVESNWPFYMDERAVVAKRSVAEASFNALASMKAQGNAASNDTAAYTAVLLKELGLPLKEIGLFMGAATPGTEANPASDARPSYMAQLEMLAKKIYQRPEFYTELYESPADVKRRSVAMQAIGNMVDRDTYKSYLRSEEILSVLLETKLIPLQEEAISRAPKLEAINP